MTPLVLGPRDVRLAEAPARGWTEVPGAPSLPWAGRALLPCADGVRLAVADGNRSAVLEGPVVAWGGRAWLPAVKGVGARTVPFAEADELGRDGAGRVWAAECWLGEAPFGAQGEVPAARALALTARATDGTLGGLPICPVVAVAELPPPAAAPWWYRRYAGRWVQEHRLVPGNVRLRAAGSPCVGEGADALLDAFGLGSETALDAFLDRLLATGLAAATLWARTVRPGPRGPTGLGYDDVWLDKDAILAADGALCFADLEGLVEVDGPPDERVRDQLDRTLYEVLAAADAWLRAGERRFGRARSREGRRRGLAERLALALSDDPFVDAEPSAARLDLVVRPGGDGAGLRVTVLDLEADRAVS